MENIVLVVNGKPGVGKDEFTKNIKNLFIMDNTRRRLYNFISTVDHIKEIALEKFGWDGVKDEKGRRLLSDLKDASTRYNLGPFKKIIEQIDHQKNFSAFFDHKMVTIIHCREPEEIQRFKDYYGEECKTILIKRNTDVEINGNHADVNVDKYEYDYVLDNNGTLEDFYEVCKVFLDKLIIKK